MKRIALIAILGLLAGCGFDKPPPAARQTTIDKPPTTVDKTTIELPRLVIEGFTVEQRDVPGKPKGRWYEVETGEPVFFMTITKKDGTVDRVLGPLGGGEVEKRLKARREKKE